MEDYQTLVCEAIQALEQRSGELVERLKVVREDAEINRLLQKQQRACRALHQLYEVERLLSSEQVA